MPGLFDDVLAPPKRAGLFDDVLAEPALAPVAPERPGFLDVLGDAVQRGATSALAGTLHAGSDFVDQTVGTAVRGITDPLGLGDTFDDPLGAATLAATSAGVEREINADRVAVRDAIGRPSLGDFADAPLDAAGQYGLHLANLGGESLPVMAAAIATRNPELAAGLIGGVTGAQEYTDLRGQGVDRLTAAATGLGTGAVETAGEAVGLPFVMGRGGGLGSVVRAALAEGGQEVPVQLAQQALDDQATGRQTPALQQLGDAVDAFLVGSGIGAGGRGLSLATDAVTGERAPEVAPEAPLGDAIPPELLAAAAAELAARAPQTTPSEDTADLDALLLANLPAPEPAPAAATPTPPGEVPQRARLPAQASEQAPAEAPPTAAPAAQLPAVPNGSRAAGGDLAPAEPATPTPTAGDKAPRQPTTRKPPDLLRVIASGRGLDRESFRREYGVDPAEFTRRAGFGYLFRKQGGMTPDELREFMQESGYLPRDPEDAPPQMDTNDAFDLFDRALGGEEVFAEDQWDAVARVRTEAWEQAEREWEAEFGAVHPDVAPEDYAVAANVADIAERARAVGVDEFDIAPFSGESDADYVARLEQEIEQQEARRGTEQRADQADRGERVRGQAAGTFVAEDQPGFFPAASAAEEVAAERGRRDARRDGRTGAVVPGFDGTDLGAGRAPEQVALESAEPAIDLHPTQGTNEVVIGDTAITYGVSRDGKTVEVSLIRTPKAKRGHGSARRALAKLLDVADANGQRVVLTPEPMDSSTSKTQLEAFYRSLGFKRNTGRSRDFTTRAAMIREPRGALESTDPNLSSHDKSSEQRALAHELSRQNGRDDARRLGLIPAVNAVTGQANVPIVYVRDLAGLPANLRTKLESQNRGRPVQTAAVYDPKDQRVYLVTGRVTDPARAAWHAAHEIAGHHGLRALLGDKLDSALDLALQNPTVRKVAEAIARERRMAPRDRLLAAEEALAELAAATRTGDYAEIGSRYGVEVPEAQRDTLRGAIARFIQRVKALFGKAGFSDADVYALVENAWRAARKPVVGKGDGVESTEPAALESVDDARARAEARRNEAAGTLPVARGSAGWNYDSSQWLGRKGRMRELRADLQDKMLAWRDVQGQIEAQLGAALPDAQNVYRLENLMHGRVSNEIDRIEREQVKPLMEAMQAAGVKPAQLEEYLYARHAAERNAQIATINPAMPDGGSGMTNAEAQAILAVADRAKLDPLARMVDKITRATRRRLLGSGLITQDAFDAMEAQYEHYVPLRGQAVSEDADFGGTGMAGRGLDSRGKLVRNALGRGAGNRAQNILAEIIGDAERAVITAEKARVGRAVMRIVLANPNPALWQVEPVQTERALDANGEVYEKVVNDWSDPAVVAVRHKGQLYKVQINSVPLAKALNHVGVDQLGTLTRYAGAVNRYFSAILTKYNPAFTPVNASRDALFGLTGLAAEHGEAAALDAALHYPQAAAAAFQQARGKQLPGEWGEWAAEFAAHGGKTGYVNLPSTEDLARKIGTGKLTGYSPQGLNKATRAIGEAIGTLNDAVENALRLSAFVTLRKRGKSAEQAAAYAKDLTVNFNRKGFDGSTWNAWFLFYNASLQGAHRTSKLLRSPKTHAYLGMLAGAQVLATMAAMGMRDDNDEPLWNKVPDHVKRRNLVIVTGDGGLLTIPMPYGFNLFPYVAGRITEAVLNADRGDERASDRPAQLVADTLSAATQSFSPVPLDTGVIGLVPQALRIPLNVWANRNDFGNRIRSEEPFSKSDVPRASMGRPDTLEVFKLTATGLNRLGGGDELTPPPMSLFDVAPEDLEYLLGELTGGPGNLVVDIATSWQKATGPDKPEMTARDIPIAKRFVSNIDEQAAQQALFYQRRETIDRSLKRVRHAYRAEGPEAAEAMLKASPELKGAAFKRRKRATDNGPVGSIIETDGSPQIIVADDRAVYGAYKAAEEAINARRDHVEAAFVGAPSGIVPNEKTRQRDAFIRTEDRIRQAAQANFNDAWVRDVVGTAE